jgi:hypothetical protein
MTGCEGPSHAKRSKTLTTTSSNSAVRSKEFVQKVLIRILDHLYEPQFLDCSHGFRPGRSQHTCLKQIRRECGGALWYIVGDLSCKVLDHPVGRPPGNHRARLRVTGRPDQWEADKRTQRLTRLGFWGKHVRCPIPTDLGAFLNVVLNKVSPPPQQKAWKWPPKRTLTKRMAIPLATRWPLLGLSRSLWPFDNQTAVGRRPARGTARSRCVRPSSAYERLCSHFLRDSRFNKRLRPSGGLAASLGRLLLEGPKGTTSAERLNRPQNGGRLPLVYHHGDHATLWAPYCPLLANMQLHELDKFVLRLKHILEA